MGQNLIVNMNETVHLCSNNQRYYLCDGNACSPSDSHLYDKTDWLNARPTNCYINAEGKKYFTDTICRHTTDLNFAKNDYKEKSWRSISSLIMIEVESED